MKDSTANDVYRWLLEHAAGCGQCAAVLEEARTGDLNDRVIYDRCCRAGQPMVHQFQRKTLRERGQL